MDQLLKEAELLRNESELARAEHANQLLDVQAAAHRSKAAAEQREAALQVLSRGTKGSCAHAHTAAAVPSLVRRQMVPATWQDGV